MSSPDAARPSAGSPVGLTRPGTVLVLEPAEDWARQIVAILEGEGYDVTLVTDTATALAAVEQGGPDILLAAQDVPGINEAQTRERFQHLDRTLQILLTVPVTARESVGDLPHLGVSDYLLKPVVPEELRFRVATAMRRRILREALRIYEAGTAVFTTLELEDLLQISIRSIVHLLMADDASILLIGEDKQLSMVASHTLPREEQKKISLAVGERIAGAVAATGESLILHGLATDHPRFQGLLPIRPIHSSIIYPLGAKGAPTGVLTVARTSSREPFRSSDLDRVTILASQIGLAIENARLFAQLQEQMRLVQRAQEDLLQSRKLSALGEMVSGIAHELNNPLTGVLGFSEILLMDRQTPPAIRTSLERIAHEGERCRRIVQNLLQFSRQQRAEKRLVQLNDLVQRVADSCRDQLAANRITVRTALAPDLPQTVADPYQLEQVIVNLLNNARDAVTGRPHDRWITLTTRATPAAIQIQVSDSGPGVSPEVASRVFDPFFTTKGRGRGTGLGLSVSYGIITHHGGTISLSSAEGNGAVFTVQLPIDQSAVDLYESLPPIGLALPAGKILVVDDEPVVIEVVAQGLQRIGYQVERAGGGTQALTRLEAGGYDIVLSDVRMPGMGGLELFRAIQRRYPALEDRVIFMTGETIGEQVNQALAETGLPILVKPFGVGRVHRAIQALLNPAP